MPSPGVGQSSPLRPPLVQRPPCKPFNVLPNQSGKCPQPSQSSSYSQGQLPKREITFPPDSVEATLPVLYRRKRMCRADLGPVDAWRIIMSLRSGLLAESCYALDMLNILLFDDSSVGYFGLNQWPGLLDLLLEHFLKSLSDMFEGPFAREDKQEDSDIDLGGITAPIDQEAKSVLLKSTNFTLISRKGIPVKFIEKNDEIFITDHHRDWDVKGDAAEINVLSETANDPIHLHGNHILPTFQAEFSNIPFNRRLEDKPNKEPPPEEEAEPHRTTLIETLQPSLKSSDKKRRTKTISDVISRIKKESSEENDVLALEFKQKAKTDVNCEKVNFKEEQKQNSVDLNNSVNEEDINSGKYNVRDVAKTLKRRRMSDYEDEAYSRDEASLVLLTESQDCVAKRAVCLSNILRNLTFIPGNESEFARSSTFLGLVGKLLLLHHDHPLRTQKTRNYDREVINY